MAENRLSLPVQELDTTSSEDQDWKFIVDIVFKS